MGQDVRGSRLWRVFRHHPHRGWKRPGRRRNQSPALPPVLGRRPLYEADPGRRGVVGADVGRRRVRAGGFRCAGR
ncbi:MAG: hypothetical protein ACFFA6_17695 [Promethearchaeota archaeon]